MSEHYSLRISGTDIETQENPDVTLSGDEVNNWKVKRTVTDADGNVYITVKIGDQWWTAENLRVTRYRNGEAIEKVTDENAWADLAAGAYCDYENDENNSSIYGCLYNWFAVDDPRNLAPLGWHVPTDEEWQALVDFFGGEAVAGGKMKEAGDAHWAHPNEGATDESRFSALPAGNRSTTGMFGSMSFYAYFWSSNNFSPSYAPYRQLNYDDTAAEHSNPHKRFGFSIRLIRD